MGWQWYGHVGAELAQQLPPAPYNINATGYELRAANDTGGTRRCRPYVPLLSILSHSLRSARLTELHPRTGTLPHRPGGQKGIGDD